MHPFINVASQAAYKAGKIIISGFDRLDKVTITTKGKNDFATNIDQAAEDIIVRTLRQAYPKHMIVAEEASVGQTAVQLEQYEHVWIIDPLDGTTNFVHGLPHFAISIALMMQGVVKYGVVYDPLRDELFSAVKGKGAMLNARRLRVTTAKQLNQSLLGTGFPTRKAELLPDYTTRFVRLLNIVTDMRRTGSAALDLSYVAAGRLDGFWENNLCPWDMAAGALLVQEAGGMCTAFDGTAEYLQHGSIVATNPRLLKALLAELEV